MNEFVEKTRLFPISKVRKRAVLFLPHKVILFCQKKMKFIRNNRISSGGTLTNWVVAYLTNEKTLPKAQRTRGLSSCYQSNFLRSYHNFTNLDQISSSESRLKNQFLNQTSASPINLKFKISTKHSFRIATKIQLHNLYKTSASKCWTNSSFKILPELQLQNLDQPLCSKSEQKFSFRTKRQLSNL